jgi:hypothetical protein
VSVAALLALWAGAVVAVGLGVAWAISVVEREWLRRRRKRT